MAEIERAELGVDGNCGFALLGENIQEGEAEFEEVHQHSDETLASAQARACRIALSRLRKRLAPREFSYYCGSSHPCEALGPCPRRS